jgi:uncharacterized Zn-binding protein involved in type VI secretion
MLITVEGDYDTQDDCHDPPAGGGSYSITVNMQNFVFIIGKPVVCMGESFEAHETAYAGDNSSCSQLIYINGIPVCRAGDISRSSSCHTFSGITVQNQNFVYEG